MNYTSQAPDRLFPTACVSLLDIDEAIEELQRVKTMGHVGANIPCVPPVDKPVHGPRVLRALLGRGPGAGDAAGHARQLHRPSPTTACRTGAR